MPQKEPCPSRNQLEEVTRGKLPSPQMELLAHHVEACPQCEETLQNLRAEDTFTDMFRAEAGKSAQPVEPVVEALIQRMQTNDSQTHAFADARTPAMEETNFLAPPEAPDEIGRLAQYRVLKVLGKGGMGMVLQGHDPHLDRLVALKVMLPSIAANDTAKHRFLREARSAAKLRSDHIVTIYQVSEDRGIPFLAMEYLEGAPLDRFLADGRKLSIPQILRIGREITKGLADAHDRGLIHRDIKPGNIWLDQSHAGRATILDFGLARFDTDIHITQSGAIVGTPAYMAPEQARGEKVDARADLFSLGCVLYRLCAGDIPFKAETTMGVLMALAMTDPTPPATINSQIPPALSELIMKLLEKDAAKRPVSAREVVARLQEIEKATAALRADLEKIDTGKAPSDATNLELSLATTPPAMAQPSTPPGKRRRVLAALVMVGLLVIGGAWALMQMGVIRFSNEQGDYVITTDDPDFAFSVSKGAVILEDRKTKRKYNLKVVGGNKAAGEYELEVTDIDAELAFKTKSFTIRRGQEVALKAWFERKQVAAETPTASPRRFALRFEHASNASVHVPKLSFDRSGPWTIEVFATLTEDVKPNHLMTLLNLGFSPLLVVGQDNVPRLTVLQAKEKITSLTGASIKPRQRVHVAGVRHGNSLQLFLDGKKVGHQAIDEAALLGLDAKLVMGVLFDGLLDQVRISKAARYFEDFAPAQRFVPDKDTVALYHFDEGTGDKLTDSSGNGHDGKIVGARWVNADGSPIVPPVDYALRFDGKARVEVTNLKLDTAASFTLEAFVNLDKGPSKGDPMLLGFKDLQHAVKPGFWFFGVTKPLPDGVSRVQMIGPYSIASESRTHIAAVRSGNQFRVFLNGKQVASKPTDVPLVSPKGTFSLGDQLVGVMDEVRISKNARYDKDFTPAKRFEKDADTLALYHCDEGSGDVLKDSSGNGHDGKIVGARWVKADGTPLAPPPSHAVAFHDNARISVAYLKLPAEGDFTLEGWVTPTAQEADNNFRVIDFANKAGLSASGSMWQFNVVFKDGISQQLQWPLIPGRKVHVAAVRAGEDLILYVEGKMAARKNVALGPLHDSDALVWLGGAKSAQAKGHLLGPVRISKIARYTSDKNTDFIPPRRFEPDADTLAAFNFEEGEGRQLTDISGNNLHGNILNATWVNADGSPR